MTRLPFQPTQPLYTPLETYFREIKRTPLLNAEDEKHLACRIEEGKGDARDHLVRANLRLVVNIARSYTGKGLDFQDLIEEGNLGLLRAVEDFDPTMNTRFSTYASYWIKQSIRSALVNKANTIRVPAYLHYLSFRWQRATVNLQERFGRPPTQNELARHLNLSPKRLDKLKNAMRLNAFVPTRNGRETRVKLGEKVVDGNTNAPDIELSEAEDRRQVVSMLDKLDDREAAVLRLRFGFTEEGSRTLETIGERLGLTRERVRQIECEALSKLRRGLQADSNARLRK